MIKILLDDKTITRARRLHVHLSAEPCADDFEFELDNTADQYTSHFVNTKGQKLAISIAKNQSPSASSAPSAVQYLNVFNGLCDSIDFKYHPEQVISAQGRDYTGLLIDEIITPSLAEKFSGKSASQIVSIIAREYGFTADATSTKSTDLDDKLYTPGTHVWAVVVELAKKCSFDCFVTKDRVISFKSRKESTDIKRTYSLSVLSAVNSSNLLHPSNLEFSKDLTDSLALKVEIIGYDTKRKERISYIAESPLRNRDNYKIISETHLELKTSADVKLCAENKLKEYSKDLITGSCIIPIDPELEPSDCIQFKNGGFAGTYYLTDVTHDCDKSGEITTLQFASKVLFEVKTKEQKFPPTPKPFTF
jgi:hypothetical protein